MNTLYVSYDGALDPLGSSQIIPYLVRLATRGVRPTLVSFEKPERWAHHGHREALRERLERQGVSWHPCVYHKRPRIPATLFDCAAGLSRIAQLARTTKAAVIHCRGDVAMAIARWSHPPRRARLLYDMRGLFADERSESGSWAKGSVLDRLVRRVEHDNLKAAKGLVILTRAVRTLLQEERTLLPPHRVIPTCADLDVFYPRGASEKPEFGLAFTGGLGTWQKTPEMVAFARVASSIVPGKTLVLTPQVEEARRAGLTPDWAEVRSVPQPEVATWLRRARAAFFFYEPTRARIASCPTKLAEALGTGLPVITNPGIGDMEADLVPTRTGIMLRDFSETGYRQAAQQLRALIDDPETAIRTRRLAEQQFDVQLGVQAYFELYQELASRSK